MSGFRMWAPYVPVATRLFNATKAAESKAKKTGRTAQPVTVSGRRIGTTFWGKAWCENLVTWKDYDNRLPRGMTYLQNGSVVDLHITPLNADAIVAGSEPYTVQIQFKAIPQSHWTTLRKKCTSNINSLLDLLSGKFSSGVMEHLTSTQTGLFPAAQDLKMSCSCPDSSRCCKHIAAVFYAIAVRLDHQPQLLFQLRGVDHLELVAHAVNADNLERELSPTNSSDLQIDNLGELFGIELATSSSEAPTLPEPADNPPNLRTETIKQTAVKKKSTPKQLTTPKKPTAANTKPAAKTKAVKKTKPAIRTQAAAKTPPAAKQKAPAKKAPAKKASAQSGRDKRATTATRINMQVLREALADVSASDIQTRERKPKSR